MNIELFKKIAESCKRWSDRSISVAKAVLVDEVKPSMVAKEYSMSSQQVNVIKTRFKKKVDVYNLEQFMRKEAPFDEMLVLKSNAKQIEKLNSSGYSSKQIKDYLAQNNINVTVSNINKFLGNR
jgi:hypothetical protein